LRRRFGGREISLTVPFTGVRATSAKCDFVIVFKPLAPRLSHHQALMGHSIAQKTPMGQLKV